MTVVSTKEFNANQDKYFDMALDEQIFVKRGDYTYLVSNANNGYPNEYDEVLEPDDDFRRAITGEELLKRIYIDIDKKFASRIQ
jgi:hypothetical protein